MLRRRRRGAWWIVASRLSIATVVAACGGDDAAPPLDGPTVDGPPATGTITVRVDGLTGVRGMTVEGFIIQSDRTIGVICVPVTADPFSFAELVSSEGDPLDPCMHGPTRLFYDGVYEVRGLIRDVETIQPLRCATATVTSASGGDVTLVFGACQ